jgi:hypothetical protein
MNYDGTNIGSNPIKKMNMKYSLPNCAQPLHRAIVGCFVYYLPEKCGANLWVLDLRDGRINQILCQNVRIGNELKEQLEQK